MDIRKLKEEYLIGLLEGDRHKCHLLVKDALQDKITLQDLYENVFAPAMVEIGRLWEINEISIAQEHLATAITQSVISSFYEYLFSHKNKEYKGKMILTCVGDELHELGPRMLADLIEMDGWDVRYLGANMPIDAVFEMVVKEKPDLIGIAATIEGNKEEVRALIKRIKEEYGPSIPVMVGGLAFTLFPDLFDFTGGDFIGKNFNEALEFTRKLAAQRS